MNVLLSPVSLRACFRGIPAYNKCTPIPSPSWLERIRNLFPATALGRSFLYPGWTGLCAKMPGAPGLGERKGREGTNLGQTSPHGTSKLPLLLPVTVPL